MSPLSLREFIQKLSETKISPFCWLSLSLSFVLRFCFLQTSPNGLDIDEAAILYWGEQFLLHGKWYVYAPEFTRWEMLPGVIYSLLSGFGTISVRLIPALIGVIEGVTLFTWLKLNCLVR